MGWVWAKVAPASALAARRAPPEGSAPGASATPTRNRAGGSMTVPPMARPWPRSVARRARPTASRSNTGLASLAPTSMGSPDRHSTARMPRAWAPSRSAASARRLRSRQVSWSTGSRPSPAASMAAASGVMPTRAVALSVTLTASTRPRRRRAARRTTPGSADRGGTSSPVTTNRPASSSRARFTSGPDSPGHPPRVPRTPPGLRPGRGHGVGQEQGHGHGADPARDRGEGAGDLGDLGVDVADDAAADPVVADVDHGRPRLDHVAGDHGRPAGRRHQHVGLAGEPRQVPGAGVAEGHGGVGPRGLGRQEHGQGPADQQAPADDDHVAALDRDPLAAQQLDDADGRAGGEPGVAAQQPALVLRVEAVDVLGRVDGVLDLDRVQPGRQRQLDQDAVDLLVGVEPGHRGQHVPLGGVGRQLDPPRPDPRPLGRPLLGADIDAGGLVVADQHRGQGRAPALGGQLLDLLGQLGPDRRRRRPAVQHPRDHRHLSPGAVHVSAAARLSSRGHGSPISPIHRGTTPAVPRTPPIHRGTTPAVPRTPPAHPRRAGRGRGRVRARRAPARPAGAVLRHQPGAVVGRGRSPLRPAREPVLEGPAPGRPDLPPARPRRGGRAARPRPGHHQPGRAGHRRRRRPSPRGAPGRRRAPGRQGRRRLAGGGGHPRRGRLPDRLRPSQGHRRPPARPDRRVASLAAPQPQRPQRPLPASRPGRGVRRAAPLPGLTATRPATGELQNPGSTRSSRPRVGSVTQTAPAPTAKPPRLMGAFRETRTEPVVSASNSLPSWWTAITRSPAATAGTVVLERAASVWKATSCPETGSRRTSRSPSLVEPSSQSPPAPPTGALAGIMPCRSVLLIVRFTRPLSGSMRYSARPRVPQTQPPATVRWSTGSGPPSALTSPTAPEPWSTRRRRESLSDTQTAPPATTIGTTDHGVVAAERGKVAATLSVRGSIRSSSGRSRRRPALASQTEPSSATTGWSAL